MHLIRLGLYGLCLLLLALVQPALAESNLVPLTSAKFSASGAVFVTAPLPNGQVVIAGDFDTVNGIRQPKLARLNADGTLDQSWRPQIGSTVLFMVIQGDEVYLTNRSGQAFRIRLSEDGAVDPAWSIDAQPGSCQVVAVSGPFVYANVAVISKDGASLKRVLRRYFRGGTGKQDTKWRDKELTDQTFGVVFDEKYVYAGGVKQVTAGVFATSIRRYSVTGAGEIDKRWRFESPGSGYAAVLADGFLYVNGTGLSAGRSVPVSLARLSTNSALAQPDLNWPEESVATLPDLFGIAVGQSTAYLLNSDASGNAQVTAVSTGPGNPNGLKSYQTDFAPVGGRYFGPALQGDRLYASAGDRGNLISLVSLATANGKINQTFRPEILSDADIRDVFRLPDGTMYVAGTFASVGGVAVRNLVRILPDGQVDTSWIVPDLFLSPAKIFTDGTYIYAYDTYSLLRVTIASPATIDPDWQPVEKVNDFADPNREGRQVRLLNGAAFSSDSVFSVWTSDTFTDARLLRIPFNGDGSPDPAWNAPVGGSGNNIPVAVGGGFVYTIGRPGSPAPRFAVNSGGTPDPNWSVAEDCSQFATDSRYLYTAGFGALRRHLLTGTGGADSTWVLEFAGQREVTSILPVEARSYANSHVYFTLLNNDGGALVSEARRLFVNRKVLPGFPQGTIQDPTFGTVAGSQNGFLVSQFAGPRWLGAIATDAILGGSYFSLGDAPATAPTLFSVLPEPTLTLSGQQVFARVPNSAAVGIRFFRLTSVAGGTLSAGARTLAAGELVTTLEAGNGLTFTPDPNFAGPRSASLASALAANGASTGATSATIDLTSTVPARNRYRMTVGSLKVREGKPSADVIVEKLGDPAGRVTFELEEGSARLGTHFSALPALTLDFPAGDSTLTISVPLINDQVYTRDKSFRVVLTEASDEGLLLSPNATYITIQDDDPLDDTASVTLTEGLGALPPATASLKINLSTPLGAWRLEGEPIWHAGGDTVPGLSGGNYFVEFRPTNGFLTPPRKGIPLQVGESIVSTVDYPRSAAMGMGAVTVEITPASVATAPPSVRGMWRVVGGDPIWRSSGEEVNGLPIGTYDLELRPVPGRDTPPSRRVKIGADAFQSVPVTYFTETETTGALPETVLLAIQATAPYAYVGQISTAAGFASGTAVRSRAVLTVAHALFDEVAFSYAPDVFWSHQRSRGGFDGPAQLARGIYVREGYSDQRRADLAERPEDLGISTPESQQLDIAVIWFNSPCARGAFSGYLRTDAEHDWLGEDHRRILAGYPVERVPAEVKGRLQATDPEIASTFASLNYFVRATDDLAGFGGMSGGPLFVETNGIFYPAGVFLGGTAQCLVRVIDRDAVDLINRGESSGNGGDNNVGGGAALASAGLTVSNFAPTLFTCSLSPPEAVAAGAQWRIAGERDYRDSNASTAVPAGLYRIEFKPVNGFAPPAAANVEAAEGQKTTIRKTYKPGVLISTSVSPQGAGVASSGFYPTGELATLRAKAGPDFVFKGWMENGQTIESKSVLTLNVTGPRTLVAVFEPGTFILFAATYSGLHLTGDQPDGLATFALTGRGNFTLKVAYAGKTYSTRGKLDENGEYLGKLGAFRLLLSLDRTDTTGVVKGFILDGSAPEGASTFAVAQSPFVTARPTPLAGNYTLLLPSQNPADPSRPPGSGYATAKITPAGAITFSGALADGVPISGGAQLLGDGRWPFYAASGKEAIAGTLQFLKVPGQSDAEGVLRWVRPAGLKDKYYPGGFVTTITSKASAYTAPAIDYFSATLVLSGGGLNGPVSHSLTITEGKAIAITSSADAALKLTINKSTGLISGNLTNPVSGNKITAGGVVFQATRRAAGFLKTPPATTGAFEISP